MAEIVVAIATLEPRSVALEGTFIDLTGLRAAATTGAVYTGISW